MKGYFVNVMMPMPMTSVSMQPMEPEAKALVWVLPLHGQADFDDDDVAALESFGLARSDKRRFQIEVDPSEVDLKTREIERALCARGYTRYRYVS